MAAGSVQDKFKLNDILKKSYIQFTVDEIKTETETDDILNDLLLYLTERGEYLFVRRLLENGASVNSRNKDCLTPLHISIQKGHNDIFELLISHRADLAAISKWNICPIYTAAEYDRPQMLRRILELDPSQISQRDSYDSLPIHVAAFKGHLQCLEVLLDSSDDCGINTGNLFGFTPLHFAVQNQQRDAVQLLLKRGANPNVENIFGYRPLHLSVVTGDLGMTKDLIAGDATIDAAADNNEQRETPLHSAIRSGQKEIVRLLIEAGAKMDIPNLKGETPLELLKNSNLTDIKLKSDVSSSNLKQYSNFEKENLFEAIKKNDFENFKEIIKPGYDLNFTNEFNSTLTHSVIENKYLIFLKFLLDSNVDLNVKDKNGKTPLALILHDAEFWFENDEETCEEALKKIIELTEDLNVQNEDGDTVLHFIIRYRNLELLDILMELQIDMNIKNKNSETPFDLVLQDSHFWLGNNNAIKNKFVKKLVNSLEDVNSKYECGKTVLHFASGYDNVELIHFLFERGALLNVRDTLGRTPLHTSLFNNCANASVVLINLGADVNQRSNNGWQPIHWAALNGHVPVVDLLIKKGASVNSKDGNGNQPLHCAARWGRTEVVQFLIGKGAEINGKNNQNQTPLHICLSNNCLNTSEALINLGADINQMDNDGWLPIHLATRGCQVTIVDLMIKNLAQKKKNLNSRGPDGNTPLHAACSAQHPEIVEMLLDCDVEVNSKNNREESPLHISASSGSVTITKLLIENHCDVDGVGPEGDTPLHSAIRSGQKEIVRLLIEAGAKMYIPNLKGETPLELLKNSNLIDIKLESDISSSYLEQYSNFEKETLFEAIKKNDLKNFKEIIKPGYDLNFTNEFNSTLLHSVVKNKNLIFLNFILNFNIDVNIKDNNGETVLALILHDARFWFKRIETCKNALKKIIELTEDLNVQNEDGDTILHFVVRDRNLEFFDIFTKLKFDMNIKNNKNITPFDLVVKNKKFWFKNDNEVKLKLMKTILNSLEDINSRYGFDKLTVLHWASECDNAELIHFLFERGALLNVGDWFGNTPLHRSSRHNCLNASEALINLGADVNQKDKNSRPPLHYAAEKGHVPIVDLFIRKGANLNTKTSDGFQPLHLAALYGHTEVVKLLVDRGAEINGKNNMNETPLHRATFYNEAEVVEILLSKNADVKVKNKRGKTPLDYIKRDGIRNIYKKFNHL